MFHQYVKILLLLGVLAAMCGTVSAAMGIIAETRETSSGSTPVCTAPCECISEADAAARWGAEGYERCSKTICGQSANAMVQYYCFHQIGGTSSALPGGNAIAATSATALQVTSQVPLQTAVQTTVTAPVQTPSQAPAASGAATANPSPSYTWPAAGATPQQRSPVGVPTIFTAIGMALFAFVVLKKE